MKVTSVHIDTGPRDIMLPPSPYAITFADNTVYMNRTGVATGSDDPLSIQEKVIKALVEHIDELNQKIPREHPFQKAAKELLAMTDEELAEKFQEAEKDLQINAIDVTNDPKKTICIDCIHARRTWSEELQNEGYIGCRMLNDETRNFNIHDVEAAVVGTGWVDLRAYPFKASGGILTNDMLVTCGTRKCPAYRKRTDMEIV